MAPYSPEISLSISTVLPPNVSSPKPYLPKVHLFWAVNIHRDDEVGSTEEESALYPCWKQQVQFINKICLGLFLKRLKAKLVIGNKLCKMKPTHIWHFADKKLSMYKISRIF